MNLLSNNVPQPAKLLYTKRQAAHLLSLSLRTIDNLISRKQLSVVRIGGRVMIRAIDLQHFVKVDHPMLAA